MLQQIRAAVVRHPSPSKHHRVVNAFPPELQKNVINIAPSTEAVMESFAKAVIGNDSLSTEAVINIALSTDSSAGSPVKKTGMAIIAINASSTDAVVLR